MKTCRMCNVEKPRNEFYNSKRMSDGKDSYCRSCRRAHYQNIDKNDGKKTPNIFGSLAKSDMEPHEKLATAILIQAVRDSRNNRNVRSWLAGDECQFYCESLGIRYELMTNYLMMGCPSQSEMRNKKAQYFAGLEA